MTRCPDWGGLAREREAEPLVDPRGWNEARAHLAGCASCRREALAADPLFLFAALPPAAVPAAEWGATAPAAADRSFSSVTAAGADVAAMQSSVLALVRASRVAVPAAPRRRRPPFGGGRSGARLVRYAAALALASLFALSGGPRSPGPLAGAPDAPVSENGELATFLDSADFAQPMVEELDRPDARVYELSNADLAVVMIVDAGLDV